MSKKIQEVPIKNIVREDGAHELATSPDVQPYLRLIKGGPSRQGHHSARRRDRRLASRKTVRLAGRIGSEMGVRRSRNRERCVDLKTLSPEDLGKVVELLRSRPMQFCMFLKALLSPEVMEQVMNEAIAGAKGEG